MVNPTSGWDTVPITGKYLNVDGSPKSGRIVFTIMERVYSADGTTIYPAGGQVSVDLQPNGTISTTFPAADDPDIMPSDWTVKVDEKLSDNSGLTYYIAPTLAGGEIKLGSIIHPTIAQPASSLIKGVPGGVAALDSSGQVVDANGDPVAGVTDWASLTGKPATFAPSAHNHTEADVVGLTADLAGKLGKTDSVDTLADGVNKVLMTPGERTKVAGVQAGATTNSTDAQLRDRSTHTGTQPATSITGLAAVATSGSKADVALGNVDNTSDVNKPVSTAQAAAITAALVNSYAIIDYNSGTSSFPLRNTVTTDPNRPVRWRGPVVPPLGGGYAITGKDEWAQTL